MACELFSVEGQRAAPKASEAFNDGSGVDYLTVQGIRLIEVKVVKGKDGSTRYIPLENYGGFVQTWLSKSPQTPRISLGAKIDAKNWKLLN